MTNYYEILIKSHTDAPDYEDSCEAESIEVARVIFEGRTKTDIDVKDIVERTIESETQDTEITNTGENGEDASIKVHNFKTQNKNHGY